MNLANKITLFRIISIPFFVFFLFNFKMGGVIVSFLIFIIASISDWLDGYIARKKNEITVFGKIMDPVADKILVYSAFICFIQLNIIPFWMVIIIMARDLFVMALRVQLAAGGNILAAIFTAKIKTILEYASIIFAFFYLMTSKLTYQSLLEVFIYILMGSATFFALVSGGQYLLSSKKYITR